MKLPALMPNNWDALIARLQAKGPLAGCFVQLIECDALACCPVSNFDLMQCARILPPEVNADHWAVQLALMEVYAANLVSHFSRAGKSSAQAQVKYGKLFALHQELFPRFAISVPLCRMPLASFSIEK